MKALRISLLWLSIAGIAQGEERKVPKPPPGSVPGTVECKVARRHDPASYARDQGCLLGNLTLSCMAEGDLDPSWTLSVAQTAGDLARLASSCSPAPETPYLAAAELSLLPIRMRKQSGPLGESLCAHAATAVESACLAFYCGTQALRPASQALNEAKIGVKKYCEREVECTPLQRGLDPAQCYSAWTQAQRELDRAGAAASALTLSDSYGQDTRRAVRSWFVRAEALSKKTSAAIREQKSADVAPVATALIEQAAVPALKAMREDEVKVANAFAKQLQRQVAEDPCTLGDDACKLARKERLAAATALEASADQREAAIEKALSERSPEMKAFELERTSPDAFRLEDHQLRFGVLVPSTGP